MIFLSYLLKLIGILLIVILFLLIVAVIRTLFIRKTAAFDAIPPEVDEEKAKEYALVMSEMLKMETISSRFDESTEKFYKFQDGLVDLFPNLYKKAEVFHPGDGLVIRLKAKGTPKKYPILLMSHHDVVAASPEGWKYPPFSGHIDEEGCVWGRGAVDTKGPLFAELQALEELVKEGWENEVDVYITSSCTEEWSGPSAPKIVEWLKENGAPRLGMLLDEGGLILKEPIAGAKGRYAMVGVLEKGYGDVKFIAKGHGGHASAPRKNSPIPRLSKLVCSLEKKSPFVVKITPPVKEMFKRVAPNMVFGMKLVFANLWLFGPIVKKLIPSISAPAAAMMRTSCAFTMQKGSDAFNILPDSAYVTANLRFIHHQDDRESLRILQERANKFDVDMEVITSDSPCPIVDYTSKEFALLEDICHKIYPGYGVVPYVMTGGTDAKFYRDITDNAIRFAPVEINEQQYKSVHAVDENISSRALVSAVVFYKELLKEYSKS